MNASKNSNVNIDERTFKRVIGKINNVLSRYSVEDFLSDPDIISDTLIEDMDCDNHIFCMLHYAIMSGVIKVAYSNNLKTFLSDFLCLNEYGTELLAKIICEIRYTDLAYVDEEEDDANNKEKTSSNTIDRTYFLNNEFTIKWEGTGTWENDGYVMDCSCKGSFRFVVSDIDQFEEIIYNSNLENYDSKEILDLLKSEVCHMLNNRYDDCIDDNLDDEDFSSDYFEDDFDTTIADFCDDYGLEYLDYTFESDDDDMEYMGEDYEDEDDDDEDDY